MSKAYSYIRMSTAEQKHGDSARRQIEYAEEYAAKEGLEVVDLIEDIGVSGFKGQNAEVGALSRFLAAVETGHVERGSYLIVESLDRITRQHILDAFQLMQRIVDAGIIIVTLHDNQKYSRESFETTGGNLLVAIFSMMRAHEESQRKSDRLSAVWQQKKKLAASKGQLLGQKLPGWLEYNAQKTEIRIVVDRAAVVKEIFELSRDGWGAYSIAKLFNGQRKEPWGRSSIWQESYIKKILINRAVLGEYQPYKKVHRGGKYTRIPDGDPIENYYPAVISLGLFEQARLAIAQRQSSGKGRKGSDYANLFTGLLKCSFCGKGIRYLNKGQPPKGGRYLRCSTALLNGTCHGRALRYEQVEQSLLYAIDQLDLEFVLAGTTAKAREQGKRQELAEIESKISEGERVIENLFDALEQAQDAFSITRLTMRLDEISTELRAAGERKEMLGNELAALEVPNLEIRRERIAFLIAQISGGSTEGREHLRRALAAEIGRLIRQIKIRTVTRVPYEFRDDPSLWPEAALLTDAELASECDRVPFEFSIHYHSGELQLIDPLTDKRFRLPSSPKANLIMKKWKHPSEESLAN